MSLPLQLRADMGELEQRLGSKGGSRTLLPGIAIPGIATANEPAGSHRSKSHVAPKPPAKSPGGSPKARRPSVPSVEAGVCQPMAAPTQHDPHADARACAPSPSEESAWVV